MVNIYYHICAINNWESIFSEQINSLINSELYKKTNNIIIGALGPKENTKKIHKYIAKYHNINVVFRKDDILEYEFPTLMYLYNDAICSKDNYKILYLHCKGISYYNDPVKTQRIADWRKYMEYFCIDHHEVCMSALDSGFDMCGVNWYSNVQHFSGNFWWTHANWIRTLKPPIKKIDVVDAEYWIAGGRGFGTRKPNPFVIHCSNICHHDDFYPKERYILE